jgi:hypothetical protein
MRGGDDMPIHDWNRVGAGLFHHFHHAGKPEHLGDPPRVPQAQVLESASHMAANSGWRADVT